MYRAADSRVCLVTKIWNSGTGWFAAGLVNGLAEAGASVVFIAPALHPSFREPHHPRITRITVPRETINNVSKLRSAGSKLARILCTLFAIFRQSANSRRFIFSIPDHELVAIPTFLFLRLLRKTVVLVVHDPLPHDFAHTRGTRFKRLLLGGLYRGASVLVTLCDAGRRKIVSEFKIPSSKIHVIPHGAFEFPRRSKMPGQRILLAFGSLRPNKNILKVIAAIKSARAAGLDVRLLVAGGGLDPANPYYQECAAAIAEDPHAFIDELGFTDDSEIPNLVARVDAFILAYSDFESQSGVAVLAGLSGRPVVASFAGGISELKPLGLVGVEIEQPVTPDTIAVAIQAFYALPLAQWQATAEAGRRQLSEHLEWKRIARCYLDL